MEPQSAVDWRSKADLTTLDRDAKGIIVLTKVALLYHLENGSFDMHTLLY